MFVDEWLVSVNCSVMSWTEEPSRLHSPWGCSHVIKVTKPVQIGIAIKSPYRLQRVAYMAAVLLLFSSSSSESCSVVSDSLWPHGPYSPWNSSGQNTGVGGLSILQGIFPTQGSNPGLLHCRWVLYQLSHLEGLATYLTPSPLLPKNHLL